MKKQIYLHSTITAYLIILACFFITITLGSTLYSIPAIAIETDTPMSKKKTSPITESDPSPSPASPMAEKHIFSPEPDNTSVNNIKNKDDKGDTGQQSIDMLLQKINREIELTGIIITPESKKAMILYKGKGSKNKAPEVYSSGASIEDYILKDIFPNYVVIAQDTLEIKLGLFKERRDRPEPPKEPPPQNNTNNKELGDQQQPKNKNINNMAESQPDGSSGIEDGTGLTGTAGVLTKNGQDGNIPDPAKAVQDANNPEITNPFVEAMQNAAMKREAAGISEESTTNFSNTDSNSNMDANPFLQAIKRARERQRSQQ
ncbi:MAG: hypothetical protein HQK65_14375 [Desulfamplus sp.]|nr:hypothetical protein [Desulfamplus sp.]